MSSRKKNSWVLICCVVALFILIFFEPAYGWRVRQWLSPGYGSPAPAAFTQSEVVGAQLPPNPENEISAMVYLQYPFGFKNELLVNAGSNEGVATGSAVTFQGVFVGAVVRTFPDSAVVQTVFDPTFKMPVRIGSQGVDALLVGGADPKATSIAKNAPVADGDMVITAAPGLPYGLPIGTVSATTTSADNLFQEASLEFAYDVNNLQTVLIER